LAFAASASPATAPSDGAPDCWFQTNGREVPAAEGDWYTNKVTSDGDDRHLFRIVVPSRAAFPVKVRVHDTESKHFAADADDADEILHERDRTRFTLVRPNGSVLATEAFDSDSPNGSVFEATITAASGPGTYLLTSETGAFPVAGDPTVGLNNDQNSFRVEVESAGPNLPEPGHEVRIEFTRATITCMQATTKPLTLAYAVPEGTTEIKLRNFDLEVGGDRVTAPLKYVSPTGAEVPGTMSGEDVWSEDILPAAGRHGPWTMTLGGLGVNNQVAFEAFADSEHLPLSVVSLNQPPQWLPQSGIVREPEGTQRVPVMRSVQLQLDEPDDGQTLRFSVPHSGHCGDAASRTHPFARFVPPASVVSGPGNEVATLRMAVGAQDAADSPYCVRVRVFDGGAARDLELEVNVTEENSTPIARAGPDKVVHEPRTRVTLRGGGSFDPDGGPAPKLSWNQVGGRKVALTRVRQSIRFRAPRGRYTFQLTASEGTLKTTDRVSVKVRNGAPIVVAPANRAVPEKRHVVMRLGSFVDPGRDGPWRVKIAWGDRTKATLRTMRKPGSLGKARYTFLRRGAFTVTVKVTDRDGATGVRRFNVTVKRACVIPNVRGKTLKRVRAALEQRRCRVGRVTRAFSSRVAAGRAVSQKPGTNKVVVAGTKVHVKLSKGPRR
jgi:hypothetical protein